MRIAVANWSDAMAGGTERYLGDVVPALHRAGHEICFLSEVTLPLGRERIRLPDGIITWCVARCGLQAALNDLRAWRPDVIFAHGLDSPMLEEGLTGMSPAVLFAHDYRGTCISGCKSFKFPVVAPCDRRFGWPCLALYFPRRCGGLSPITMWRDFRDQAQRLYLMRRYRAIVTASEHMRAEYLKHGLASDRVSCNPYPVDALQPSDNSANAALSNGLGPSEASPTRPARLLFIGRVEPLKGGQVLFDALPAIARSLGRPVNLVVAGDGSALSHWRRRAVMIQAADSRITIELRGWLGDAAIGHLAANSDVLVVPSLWPEPFGLVGPESGLRSLPAVAFAVGGISQWLIDGVNGYLAPGDPPTADGLVRAVVRCFEDPRRYAALRIGAARVARRFSLTRHVTEIARVLEESCEPNSKFDARRRIGAAWRSPAQIS